MMKILRDSRALSKSIKFEKNNGILKQTISVKVASGVSKGKEGGKA